MAHLTVLLRMASTSDSRKKILYEYVRNLSKADAAEDLDQNVLLEIYHRT